MIHKIEQFESFVIKNDMYLSLKTVSMSTI